MYTPKTPKVKVFVYKGRVEAVYADAALVEVEVIECERSSCDPSFEEQYDIAKAAGFEELYFNKTVCDKPYRSDEE